MSLTSLTYIGVYFPLLLIAYYNPFLKGNGFRKLLLLGASLGFYVFCEPIYVFLLIGMIIINYLLVKISHNYRKPFFRTIAIVIDAGILLFFKYINEFLAYGLINRNISSIAFPVGLSYFTFKLISYVADSKIEKEDTIIDVAIYISNFMTIVSGPLSFYDDELRTIRNRKKATLDAAYCGFERIAIGFGKKIIIADNLGKLANQCFLSKELSVVMAWAGAVAFSLQLLFDFAGYTDIALGTGYLFGFDLPENFNYPYMAKSISDFWKRWHMSLTKWFTKYIYIPLGGSRVKTVSRHIFNLLVVWIVTGVWHGSRTTFIVWAMIYFLLQAIEKYSKLSVIINRVHLGHFYTMLVVILQWVIFKSENLTAAFDYIRSMFACGNNVVFRLDDFENMRYYMVPFVLGIVFSTDVGRRFKSVLSRRVIGNWVYNIGLMMIYIVCIFIMISQGYSAPLYGGF